MKESDGERVAGTGDDPQTQEQVVWSELTPEEEEGFLGTYRIGRLRFPASHSDMRLPRSEAEVEERLRYLARRLASWYEQGDRRVEKARVLMAAGAWAGVDLRAVYDAARQQVADPEGFPSYEEIGPPER